MSKSSPESAGLRGKVAVITGAASGIGLAMARKAADCGMSVVLADVDPERLAAETAVLRESGADVLGVPTDVSSAPAVADLAAAAERTFGPAWLLVNNAGVGLRVRTWDVTLDDWSWVLGVNLFGVIHGLDAFLPGMLERDEGHIVNTASMAGLILGASSSSPYAASKHAVIGISEVLFRELEALGSRVGISALCPGPVATNIALAGRNRPARFGRPAPPPDAFDKSRHSVASLDPADVADDVFRAIAARQFWVLTHIREFGVPIVDRMKAAVTGRNPDASTADPALARTTWHPGTVGRGESE